MRFRNALIVLALVCCIGQAPAAQERPATPAVVNPPLSSHLRETISLDGTWDFATDPDNTGEAQEWYNPGKPLPDKVPIKVPGCWEAQGIGGPGNSNPTTPERSVRPLRGAYVGTAWYKKEVPIPRRWNGKQIWLKVGGVHAQGWFWVNGTYVAHVANYCGTYKCNVTDCVRPGGTAVVAVKVRNDVVSTKGLFSWIHRFGGLYRSVELDATSPTWIDDAYVEPLFDQNKARLHIRLASIPSERRADYQVRVSVSTLDGTPAGRAAALSSLAGNETVDLQLDIALDPFRPWSPQHPHLYKADIVLNAGGKPIDGWVERFGVRKWEVRGQAFYLNNQKHFVRGYGDDYVYPITLCSPASRQEHRERLQRAKDFGFTYVRHHTHCEIPEYYDAADEVGIMVQPELPYYGPNPSAGAKEYFRPKEDLAELITHYRRYVSLATYCTGNEGHLGSPIDVEVYQLAKQLDPTRLFIHQDGGHNTPENSDFNNSTSPSRPLVLHEYLNLATDEDPRLADKYSAALMPPCPVGPFNKELEEAGLSWKWGTACLDAGNQLQRLYQKQGLEAARLNPNLDGYIYWTIVDVGSPSAQGLLNQFWEPKAASAEFFRAFNGPTALLAKFSPAERILTEGNELTIQWWLSHYDPAPVDNATLTWKLVAAGNTLDSGRIPGISAGPGEVKAIGTTTIQVPSLSRALKARLIVNLDETHVSNSWDLWLFPKTQPDAGAGNGLCASDTVYSLLADRYPGMTRLGRPEASDAKVVLTQFLDRDACQALDQGKNVLLLKLISPSPGTKLGWWGKSDQTGTAVADHPAFGDLPHDGYLNELFFRMLQSAVSMRDGSLSSVEPLMVGHGSNGYMLYAFQARAANGKLLGSGLDLLSGNPESAYVLDQVIAYMKSERFQPKGVLRTGALAKWTEMASLVEGLNGWSETVQAMGRQAYPSFLGRRTMSFARQTYGKSTVIWRTEPVPRDIESSASVTFKWIAGTGFTSQPAGTFTLMLDHKPLVDFRVAQQSTTWTNPDATVSLSYVVMDAIGQDSSGVMKLTLPASLLEPGKKAELRVVGSNTASARWFGVYEVE